ncbi:hypothetical protein MRX96_014163 [Rhipicephalus microplus]
MDVQFSGGPVILAKRGPPVIVHQQDAIASEQPLKKARPKTPPRPPPVSQTSIERGPNIPVVSPWPARPAASCTPTTTVYIAEMLLVLHTLQPDVSLYSRSLPAHF